LRIAIIGGSGHIGTFLIPRLVRAGHEVINISRGKSVPYQSNQVWNGVKKVILNRSEEENSGRFGQKVRDLHPDVVIDLICFTLESAKQLVEALEGNIQHFISCGTIWVHGHSKEVPVIEEQSRQPFGDYGIQKAAIESYLLEKARRDGFPATILHPGHIVGPGWVPLNPAGHFNPQVFESLANGEVVCLPNIGMETVHHVHADDVALAFAKAVENWNPSIGESFHIVSSAAITLRGYAEEVAAWFGQSANLKFLPWNEWRHTVSGDEAGATWDHIAHSPNCSIEKAKRLLNYQPRYSSLEAVRESVLWLIENGIIKTEKQ
jgi:nucleoside-diphosphate-sugar epimerase